MLFSLSHFHLGPDIPQKLESMYGQREFFIFYLKKQNSSLIDDIKKIEAVSKSKHAPHNMRLYVKNNVGCYKFHEIDIKICKRVLVYTLPHRISIIFWVPQ